MPLSDELDLRKLDWEARFSVNAVGPVQSFTDIAPLLEALGLRHSSVQASVSGMEPPAAGMTEIAVWVLVSAPIIYLKSFLESWAAEDAKDIRLAILEILRNGRSNRNGRRYYPLEVSLKTKQGLGNVDFFFEDELTEEELLRRLRSAQALVSALDDSKFEVRSGPPENGFFWNAERRCWRHWPYYDNNPDDYGDYCPSED